eukprot:1188563-Prorocentrum_minimum.AAC.1
MSISDARLCDGVIIPDISFAVFFALRRSSYVGSVARRCIGTCLLLGTLPLGAVFSDGGIGPLLSLQLGASVPSSGRVRRCGLV